MYWILSNEIADENNDAVLSGKVNLELGGEISFENGVAISSIPVSKILFTSNEDSYMGRMTDHLSIGEVYGLVLSAKFRELLHSLMVENIQYIDLDIVDPKTGNIFNDYKVANIVGVVDCINREMSDITCYDDGDIKYVDSLVFDEAKIPEDLKVFRIAGYEVALVIHESVKNAIIKSGITGCVFYKPEEYS